MRVIRAVLRSRMAWVGAGFVAAFLFTTRFLTETEFVEVSRAASMVVSVIAVIAFLPTAALAFSEDGWPSAAARFALGICLICVGLLGNGALNLIWRLGDHAETWLVNNDINSAFVISIVAGLVLIVTAPNLFGRDVPPRERIWLGTRWVIAALLVVGLFAVKPDTRPVTEWLRPWLAPASAPGAGG